MTEPKTALIIPCPHLRQHQPGWLGVLLSTTIVNTFAQSLGNLAQYPQTSKQLIITASKGGYPVVEPSILELDSGNYYRLTVSCPEVKGDLSGWRLETPQPLDNAHLRLVSVGDIEVHLQGLSFIAIECDEVVSASISFVPIKLVSYEFYVVMYPYLWHAPWVNPVLKCRVNLWSARAERNKRLAHYFQAPMLCSLLRSKRHVSFSNDHFAL